MESGKGKILVVNDTPIRISNETMVIATASMRSLKSGECQMSPAFLSRMLTFRHYEFISE